MNVWSSISGEPCGVSEFFFSWVDWEPGNSFRKREFRFARGGGCRLVSLQVFYSSFLLQSSSPTLQKTFRVSRTNKAEITMLMHDPALQCSISDTQQRTASLHLTFSLTYRLRGHEFETNLQIFQHITDNCSSSLFPFSFYFLHLSYSPPGNTRHISHTSLKKLDVVYVLIIPKVRGTHDVSEVTLIPHSGDWLLHWLIC